MTELVFPTQVREQVLAQHAELRTLLGRAMDHAGLACSDVQERHTDRFRAIVRELCGRFQAHLIFEADALRPVFAVLDSWGPERIRELETEHARQGQVLNALLVRLESGEAIDQLSLATSALAADLLRDMKEEEEGWLRASLLSAVSLTIERR